MSTKLYDWLFADIEEIIDMAGEYDREEAIEAWNRRAE